MAQPPNKAPPPHAPAWGKRLKEAIADGSASFMCPVCQVSDCEHVESYVDTIEAMEYEEPEAPDDESETP